MDRILVIKLSAFGDVIQAAGAVHDIRNHHPDAMLIIMTTPPFKEMMERCPWVDSVFIDPRESRWLLGRMLHLRNRLRQLGVTLVYDLQQVGRTSFYRRWFFPDVRWIGKETGFSRESREFENKGAMERFAVQLTAAGLNIQHTLQPDLSWMAEDASALLAARKVKKPYVVLIPGSSSVHKQKRWPHYNRLAAWFKSQGMHVVTVPGPDELELCRSITNATLLTDGKPFLSLFELAGVLKNAEFIVGNDTGPTHLAAHLGRRGVALFSGHFQPTRTGIQFSRFSFLEEDDLSNLSLDTVCEEIRPGLSGGRLS